MRVWGGAYWRSSSKVWVGLRRVCFVMGQDVSSSLCMPVSGSPYEDVSMWHVRASLVGQSDSNEHGRGEGGEQEGRMLLWV